MFYRRLIYALALTLCSTAIAAQSTGVYSSYSRFGIGLVSDGVTSFNRGMGGVGIALHSSSRVNSLNPASYATIDSLSMIFDVGASFTFGRQSQNAKTLYTRGAAFEYVVAGFRLRKGLGLSFGFMPNTSIKYDYERTRPVGRDVNTSSEIDNEQNFYGDGGTHRAYIGIGWQPLRTHDNPLRLLSVGMNANLIWGTFTHDMMQVFMVGQSSSSVYSAIYQSQTGKVLTYRLDFGLQLPVILNSKNLLRTGLTASLGHGTKTEATLQRWTSVGDTATVTAKDAIGIPYVFGAGLAWEHKGMLTLAADYRYEKWDDCKVPVLLSGSGDRLNYVATTGYYKNRHRINVGAEFYPAVLDKGHNPGFLQRCRYRIGAFYSTPYMRMGYAGEGSVQDGPSEYGITAGVGVPIINRINHRSVVNVSFQWMRRQPSSVSLVTEDYYMIHLGVSFGERWFMKYKIR